MSGKLENRTAFVSGAARGLGEAIARGLHAEGAQVILADINEEAVHVVAEDLGGIDGGAVAVAVDVRDKASFARALTTGIDRLGPVEIMVNNAARTVFRSVWEIEQDEWDDVLAVNLRGVLYGSQLVGPAMREGGWGRIINLSSLAGQRGGLLAGAHYAASKAGVLALTKIFAEELAPHGVTVNALAPAAISGPMMETMPAERVVALARTIPVGRVGRPEEVAAAVVYLASYEAGFVTGTTVDINGGLYVR